jgi:HupE / UreJ protein
MQELRNKIPMEKIKYLLLLALILGFGRAEAHTLPQCKAQLIVNNKNVLIHFKAPVEIIELAQKNTINLRSQSSSDSLKNYIVSHISITDTLQSQWKISIGDISVQQTNDQAIGLFPEVTIDIYLTPSKSASLRNFTMNCDLVIHQIPTQSIIFSIAQDWQNGITENDAKQIGVIAIDIPTGKIAPLSIKLSEGTWFKGFKRMFSLGVSHIAAGTDHILFILTLLLPAMLVSEKKRWSYKVMSLKESILNLLKIVTAFTIGHSLTLLLGTLQWIVLPSQPIEIIIAISILVSAIHAIKPIYPKKEIFIAGGFGLIHGLAFAKTLSNLALNTKQLALSILGFNLGIELMQLFIIMLTFPFLMMLSRSAYYAIFRNTGAVLIGISAFAWMVERITNQGNFITLIIENIANQAIRLLFGLILLSLFSYFYQPKQISK